MENEAGLARPGRLRLDIGRRGEDPPGRRWAGPGGGGSQAGVRDACSRGHRVGPPIQSAVRHEPPAHCPWTGGGSHGVMGMRSSDPCLFTSSAMAPSVAAPSSPTGWPSPPTPTAISARSMWCSMPSRNGCCFEHCRGRHPAHLAGARGAEASDLRSPRWQLERLWQARP